MENETVASETVASETVDNAINKDILEIHKFIKKQFKKIVLLEKKFYLLSKNMRKK